jgi:hypothetical protein
MTRLPRSNAAPVSGLFRIVAADWATLPNNPGSATDYAVAFVDRSRNTGIDREADELAAAVAELNEELVRA